MIIIGVFIAIIGIDEGNSCVRFISAKVNFMVPFPWVAFQIGFGLIRDVADSVDAKAVRLKSPAATLSGIPCNDIGVFESDVKIWRATVVFSHCIEIELCSRRVVLDGTIGIGIIWPDLWIFALADITPHDAVLDIVLSCCPVVVQPSIITLRLVFYDSAVIETGTIRQIASSTSLGCVVVD